MKILALCSHIVDQIAIYHPRRDHSREVRLMASKIGCQAQQRDNIGVAKALPELGLATLTIALNKQ